MIVTEHSDVAMLWREAFLSRDPANNTHQLSGIKRISAVHISDGAAMVTTSAKHLRDAKVALAGVIGQQDSSTAFLLERLF